jgi:ribulose-bisphosphate carboxylase small chain
LDGDKFLRHHRYIPHFRSEQPLHLQIPKTFSTMAALTASLVSCPVAVAAKPSKAGFSGLARVALPSKAVPTFAQKTVSNGCRTRQMLVWEPVDNK